jgi:predicted RNA-binding protein with PIN domain
MRHTQTRKNRSQHISAVFNQLSETDQQYMETLTAHLAEIQTSSPATRLITGKKPKTILQHNKERKP